MGNHIKTLPIEVWSAPSLKVLDLSDNLIQVLTQYFIYTDSWDLKKYISQSITLYSIIIIILLYNIIYNNTCTYIVHNYIQYIK